MLQTELLITTNAHNCLLETAVFFGYIPQPPVSFVSMELASYRPSFCNWF